MRKTLSIALAAMTFAGGAISATAADARDHRHYRSYDGRYYDGRYYRRDNDGAVIAAGIAGLAIGAALASASRDRYYDRSYYYDRPYYGGGYYAPQAYYGGYYPRTYYRHCRTVSRYDPYYGGYVQRTRCR